MLRFCLSLKKKLDILPEGQGEVFDKSITLSDQEGAVSSTALCTEILNQVLSHQPAFIHAAMKPGLCKVLVLELRRQQTYVHKQDLFLFKTVIPRRG